ncbi:hypothetical protein Tco_0886487 [Tanacetum coccineum]
MRGSGGRKVGAGVVVIGLAMLLDHRKLFQVVPDDVKHMWNEWALHGLIVIRLVSQITLTLLGNERKYNPRTRVRMALYAYLLAWCYYPNRLRRMQQHFSFQFRRYLQTKHKSTHVFLAPFLLLHLGGPDSITVFALEDNELSLRHFVEIVFQFPVYS